MGLLELVGAIGVAGLVLYVAWGLWHTETVDAVKPRPLRRVWSKQDQAELDAMLAAHPRGDA